MPFAIFKGEPTIAELVARLFGQPDKGSKGATKQATEALLQANPHLNDLGSVPTGSLITIPNDLPAVASSEQVTVPHATQGGAGDRARQSMDAVAARLAEIDIRAREASQALLELAQLKLPQDEEEAFARLTAMLPSGVKAAQSRLKDLDTSQKAREESFSALKEQVTALRKE